VGRVMTRAARPVAAFVIALALASAASAPVLASPAPVPPPGAGTFGTPSALATWGTGVTFNQPVVLAQTPSRVEIVIDTEGDPGSFVAESAVGATGATTLTYTLDAGPTGILPNTAFTAHWRITAQDRSTEEGPPVSVTYEDTRFEWRTASGPIVRVHWYVGDAAFGQRALRIGEDGVARAAALLGVTETRPVDFFVYADQAAFYDALGPGTRENVGGQADASIRTLFALITPAEIGDPWVGVVIPHELTHLVFDTAVRNPYHFPPRWLDEGLAVYLSQGYGPSDRSDVAAAARDADLMPLRALGGEFPTTGAGFSLAYAESVAAIDFLVRTYGQGALVRLVRSYAGGPSDDEAFRAALGRDVAGFEAAWLEDLGAATPTRRGPNAAPPGPLPSGWSGPATPAGAPTGVPGASAPAGGSTSGGAQGGGSTPGDAAALGALVASLAVVLAVLVFVRRRRRVGGDAEDVP